MGNARLFFAKLSESISQSSKELLILFFSYLRFLAFYTRKKFVIISRLFERHKNILVKFFLMKRGRYNRPFLHITAMIVLVAGVTIAPFLADTYPVFSQENTAAKIGSIEEEKQSVTASEDVFQTRISQKPRDKIFTYTVQKGDTISSIASKFSAPNNPISVETIRWANNLIGDDLQVGDELKILPVTGLVHKVQRGDTVFAIAKKYDTEAQKIVDFPFNEFADPEKFSLVEGQMIIVPDGIKPSEKPIKRPSYIAQVPTSVSGAVFGSSGFAWPLNGLITQFASWYHMALDIAAPFGSPIIAAQSGKVESVSIGTWDGGYGNNVYISDDNGFRTHYAHLSTVNVSVGDSVSAGKTVVGGVGLTGRTTGPHLHFEIHKNGTQVNPMIYLR